MSAISRALSGIAERFTPPAEKLERELQAERARSKSEQRKLDIRWLMSSPAGRRIFYDLLEKTHLMGSTLVSGKASDVLEGRRSVGQELLVEVISIDHESWLLAQKEAIEIAKNAKSK